MVLFDEEQTAIVVSPLDNFKSAVHTHSNTSHGAAWETGVGSEIVALPAGFVHRTLLIFGGQSAGVTASMDLWGRTMRRIKRTDRATVESDLVTNYCKPSAAVPAIIPP